MLSSIEDFGFEKDPEELQKILGQISKHREGVVALITGSHNEITLTPELPKFMAEIRRESAKDREMIMQILSILEKDKK